MNKYIKQIDIEFDLHGMTRSDAIAFLDRILKQNSGKEIRVITGKGKNSQGMPVLAPAVKQRLVQLGINYRIAKLQSGGRGAIEFLCP